MAIATCFIINDGNDDIVVYVEPEGHDFPLSPDQQIEISQQFTNVPFTVKVARSSKDECMLSIWPGDGELSVTLNGENVLE